MALNFIYIDENTAVHNKLKEHLNSLEEVDQIHCFEKLKKAQKFLSENKVDVILIDPNFSKDSGIRFMEESLKDYFVVLHSARTKDAVVGFELGVFDFLPKPFDKDRFAIMLKRLYRQDYVIEKQRTLLPSTYIEVRCDLMKERILLNAISHVEAMGDYVKIVTENRKYVVLMSMKKIEERLPSNQFYRTHKSYIVNANKIIQYTAKEVVLEKIKIPLSRFRKKDFLSFMQSL